MICIVCITNRVHHTKSDMKYSLMHVIYLIAHRPFHLLCDVKHAILRHIIRVFSFFISKRIFETENITLQYFLDFDLLHVYRTCVCYEKNEYYKYKLLKSKPKWLPPWNTRKKKTKSLKVFLSKATKKD